MIKSQFFLSTLTNKTMPSLLFYGIAQIVEVIVYIFHISVIVLLFKRKKKFDGAFYLIMRLVLIIDVFAFVAVSFYFCSSKPNLTF